MEVKENARHSLIIVTAERQFFKSYREVMMIKKLEKIEKQKNNTQKEGMPVDRTRRMCYYPTKLVG